MATEQVAFECVEWWAGGAYVSGTPTVRLWDALRFLILKKTSPSWLNIPSKGRSRAFVSLRRWAMSVAFGLSMTASTLMSPQQQYLLRGRHVP